VGAGRIGHQFQTAAALASPLGKVDKITVVSTGNGSSTGMHKVTSDLTDIAAQVPALVEALSGVPMSDLLSKVRKLGDKAPNGSETAGV
jgi:flotillin